MFSGSIGELEPMFQGEDAEDETDFVCQQQVPNTQSRSCDVCQDWTVHNFNTLNLLNLMESVGDLFFFIYYERGTQLCGNQTPSCVSTPLPRTVIISGFN